ncbi:MAG: hypothetical protein IH875_11235 [Candidatus Dadabacteria bacterium]|nr:hypothetical protein [Candidatus Dadabacteria bacterium]
MRASLELFFAMSLFTDLENFSVMRSNGCFKRRRGWHMGPRPQIENPRGEPFIYVMQPFYLLTLDEQASLMNVVWYYFITEDRGVDVLTIFDEDTGNEIGTFGRKGLLIGE